MEKYSEMHFGSAWDVVGYSKEEGRLAEFCYQCELLVKMRKEEMGIGQDVLDQLVSSQFKDCCIGDELLRQIKELICLGGSLADLPMRHN